MKRKEKEHMSYYPSLLSLETRYSQKFIPAKIDMCVIRLSMQKIGERPIRIS